MDPWRVRRFDGETAAPRPPGPGLRVVLDNIRSAFNVGSIFRTCDAAGVEHLHLCGISASPPNPKVLKTSLGAERTVPWSHHVDAVALLRELRAAGYAVFAVERTDRSEPYTEVVFPEKCALVFGHEVAGVARPLLDAADRVIEIPMLGRKNSLNVATSAGVVLFELVRRRRGGTG
jgi:23S rRNA (guanosine2251-2'-O)-methyltransferase